MLNQSLQYISLPEVSLRHQSKSDIPKSSPHITQTTSENSTLSENENQSEPVVEAIALADLYERDTTGESSAEAEPPLPQIAKVPSERKKTIIITKQQSGETTADLEHFSVPMPENTSQVSQKIRNQFIRKVLLILLSQLTLTSLMVGMVFIPNSSFRDGVQNQPIVAIFTVIISLACFLVLALKRSCLRKVPWNYVLLFTFTCSSAYSLAFLASFTESIIVLISAIFTLVIILGATAFAMFSKKNPSRVGYFLCQICPLAIALMVVGLVFKDQLIQVAISAGIVFIFSLYLTYDIQRVVGNFESKYTVDDYILAALDIYIDVYIIFVEMMKLAQNLLKD